MSARPVRVNSMFNKTLLPGHAKQPAYAAVNIEASRPHNMTWKKKKF